MHTLRLSIIRRSPASLFSIVCALVLSLTALPSHVAAQTKDKKPVATAQPALTRKTTRHESTRFGYGGTITILGAPSGSITIEAWSKNEVDVTAEIELRADTEEDLTLLAAINNFVIDEDVLHMRIVTTGAHDKAAMKRLGKKLPKKLANLPWKIDYKIRVPAMVDLEINAGRGPVNISGVEGALSLNAVESDAQLTLTGGTVKAVIGGGTMNVKLNTRSWRGGYADIQLATGTLTVELPASYNAEINADILRTGQIENTYTALEPRTRNSITPRTLRARAGAGGATLAFTVGDGTLRIKKSDE